MPLFSLLDAASSSAAPAHLDPVRVVMDADIIVQVVMGGLALASIWTWTIILS